MQMETTSGLITTIPVPPRLYRPLASVVVGMYKNQQEMLDADSGAVKSVKDQGQSVTFSDRVVDYLNSSADSELFSGIAGIIDNLRRPTVL